MYKKKKKITSRQVQNRLCLLDRDVCAYKQNNNIHYLNILRYSIYYES